MRENLKYTREHEWVEVRDNIAIIGITAHAAESLGDVVFVELPDVGKTVEAGGEFAVVESVKAASEVYAPVSGEIIEVNEDLENSPEMVNNEPFDDGWFVKIKLSAPGELSELMSAEEYDEYVKEVA